MDTVLFLECEEEELEPWQQVDNSVEEDPMDLLDKCDPVLSRCDVDGEESDTSVDVDEPGGIAEERHGPVSLSGAERLLMSMVGGASGCIPPLDSPESNQSSGDEAAEHVQKPSGRKQRHGRALPGGGDCWAPALLPSDLFEAERRRGAWRPSDYMDQYLDAELMAHIASCTNASGPAILRTSVDEVFRFLGASILMSCVPYPQTRMFWSSSFRIPAISDRITRDRFFKLRKHLKVVVDRDVSEETRRTDRFWRMRPFVERVLRGCLVQDRPGCVSIDEQSIPFAGVCPGPRHDPLGMKNFVLTSADGLVLDFELYQGTEALSSQVQASAGLGLGALVLERLARTLLPGTRIYCDRFFAGTQTLWTGVRRPTPPAPACGGRVRTTGRRCGGVPAGAEPAGDAAGNAGEAVRPVDRTAGFYRLNFHTKKWTVRLLMHFTDLALANSWLLYRRDNADSGTAGGDAMQFLEFRMSVAQAFLAQQDSKVRCFLEDTEPFPRGDRAHRFTPVPHISVRTAAAAHLPEMVNLRNPMRCREKGCGGKSRVRCMTCNVFLCLQTGRNCFATFHTRH